MADKKKILIVDEEGGYGELLKEVLSSTFRIIDTDNCKEAESLASLNLPDMVIIDVEASGERGVELCETIKDDPETRDIPVLLITSLIHKDIIISGLKAGANDYILKPLCLPELVARIESHLRTQGDYEGLEHRDLLMLLELSETISVTRSPNAILRLIVSKVSKILDVARCSVISLVDSKKVIVKASSDLEHNVEIKLDLHKYPEIRKAIETKQSVTINDIHSDPLMTSVRQHIESLPYKSIIVIPLIKKESVIGTFFLRTASYEKEWVSERVYKLSTLVANIAANALENAILFESIKSAQEYFEEVSIRDDLTKLFNRRHFYERLEEEFKRAKRHNEPLSLVYIDIDNFKEINDSYGHNKGDLVLKEVGKLLKATARETDIPARCGGDEFTILLPNTDPTGAKECATRVSSIINSHQIKSLDKYKLTASIGFATYQNQNLDSCDDLVKCADDAMYAAKATGKG